MNFIIINQQKLRFILSTEVLSEPSFVNLTELSLHVNTGLPQVRNDLWTSLEKSPPLCLHLQLFYHLCPCSLIIKPSNIWNDQNTIHYYHMLSWRVLENISTLKKSQTRGEMHGNHLKSVGYEADIFYQFGKVPTCHERHKKYQTYCAILWKRPLNNQVQFGKCSCFYWGSKLVFTSILCEEQRCDILGTWGDSVILCSFCGGFLTITCFKKRQ